MNNKEKAGYREGIDGPFGPPPEDYKYRCSVCRRELMINEAIIGAGIGMAKFHNEYYEGYMPKAGCPGCYNYTMEYVEEE